MFPTFYFIIPNVDAFISGGNIYNKQLINGLKKLGVKVVIQNLKTFQKSHKNEKGTYIFDTLFLKEIAHFLNPPKPSSPKNYLLVHHLESLHPPNEYSSNAIFQKVEFPILNKFDGFITSSHFTANYLKNKGLKQPKIVTTPALVPLPNKIILRKPWPINALMIANLVERKGILPFLEKLGNSDLIGKANLLHIHLVGSNKMDKNYADKCLNLLNKHSTLAHIFTYHGAKTPKDLIPFFQKANLFISTAFMETYGMALQEARAWKIPILALAGGNVKEHIKSGLNGFLVKDMDGLVGHLYKLLEYPNYLQKYLGYTAKDREIDQYTWTIAAKKFLQQWRQINEQL